VAALAFLYKQSPGVQSEKKTFWTPKNKFITGVSLLALGLTACTAAGSALNSTEQTEEGKQATNDLTALATPSQALSTPQPGSNLETGVVPELDRESKSISVQYLLSNGQLAQNRMPEATPFPPNGNNGAKHENTDLSQIQYANKVFGEFRENWNDPMWVMKYLVSQGPWQGADGGLTVFPGSDDSDKAFAGLNIYREKATIPGQEYTIREGYPRGLVIKYGSGINILGRNGNDIAISFEEYVDRGSGFQPNMRFAVISKSELGRISSEFLPQLDYYPDDRDGKIISFKGEEFELNIIDDEMMNLIRDEAGEFWADKVPKHINDSNETDEWTYMPDPVIKKVPQELLAQVGLESLDGLEAETKFGGTLDHPHSYMKWIYNHDNQPVLVARFNVVQHEWSWHKPWLRDYADIKNKTIGAMIASTRLSSNPLGLEEFNGATCAELNFIVPYDAGLSIHSEKDYFNFSEKALTVDASGMVPLSPIYVTFNINPDSIIKKITSRTKVILATHIFGSPCKIDKILKIAQDKNICVIV